MAQQPSPASITPQTFEAVVTEHRTWFMVVGILMIVLGVVAIAHPFVTTIAVKVFLGWIFLIGGLVQIFHAFSTQRWSAFFFNLLVGLLYVIAGGWLAFFPLTGILTLTVFLAVMFIVQGIIEAAMAFRLRPQAGWGWVLFSGLCAFAVGVLIFGQLPSAAAWAIGLLVGINMITSGWAYFFLALAAGKKA